MLDYSWKDLVVGNTHDCCVWPWDRGCWTCCYPRGCWHAWWPPSACPRSAGTSSPPERRSTRILSWLLLRGLSTGPLMQGSYWGWIKRSINRTPLWLFPGLLFCWLKVKRELVMIKMCTMRISWYMLSSSLTQWFLLSHDETIKICQPSELMLYHLYHGKYTLNISGCIVVFTSLHLSDMCC